MSWKAGLQCRNSRSGPTCIGSCYHPRPANLSCLWAVPDSGLVILRSMRRFLSSPGSPDCRLVSNYAERIGHGEQTPPSYSPLQRAGRVARVTNHCSKVSKHDSRGRLCIPQRLGEGSKERTGKMGRRAGTKGVFTPLTIPTASLCPTIEEDGEDDKVEDKHGDAVASFGLGSPENLILVDPDEEGYTEPEPASAQHPILIED